MTTSPAPDGEDAWTPATSRPGELYTVEGRIRATGAFARGLRNRDPRGTAYRRSMRRMALGFLLTAAALVAAAVLIAVLV